MDKLKTLAVGLAFMAAAILYTNSSCDPYSPGNEQRYDKPEYGRDYGKTPIFRPTN